MSIVVRYLEKSIPKERFLTYLPNQGHKAQDTFDGLSDELQKRELEFKDCRGQSYDNASAMSGAYNGLRALFLKKNHRALWVPCLNHSLNLVGTHSMDCCSQSKLFFSFLEQIYVYFTGSTKRYDLLTIALKAAAQKCGHHLPVPKRVSLTRWSSRADATKSLVLAYLEIIKVLQQLAEEDGQAEGLVKQMLTLEIAIFAVLWNDILQRVNETNKNLQNPRIDFNTSISLMQSLKLASLRNKFKEFEQKGIRLCGHSYYKTKNTRKRARNVRLNPLDYAHAEEADFSHDDRFRITCFIPVIDQFEASLADRISAYTEISGLFGFLRDLDIMDSTDIKASAENLVEFYNEDLDDNLGNELVQLREFVKMFLLETKEEIFKKEGISFERWMYKLLLEKEVETSFPNVDILFRIYLVIMSGNVTAERSFSSLKNIKNPHRTSISRRRLNDLSNMAMNSDILREPRRELKFFDVIEQFSVSKCRKVNL